MHYTTDFDATRGLCTVRISGKLTRPKDNATLQLLAVDCHRQHGCRLFLFDAREAKVTSGTLEAFEAGAPKGKVADTLRLIRAAVVHRELGPDERFYETVAYNRGFQLRMFDSIAKAMDWLTSSGT